MSDDTRESWARRLSPETRQALRDLHELRAYKHLRILTLVGLWLAAGVAAHAVPLVWLRLPLWLVAGLSLHGLGIFMHEAAHHNLFRRPVLDRLLGFLCGAPVLFSCSCYRATHQLHHRHENGEHDPDNLEALVPDRRARTALSLSFLAAGALMYTTLITACGPFRARSWSDRVLCVIEPALLLAIYWGLFSLAKTNPAAGAWLFDVWVAGLLFAIPIANVRGLAEHSFLDLDLSGGAELSGDSHPRDRALHGTRSLPSNRLVSFFFCNQNYHLEHHLFPKVPWHNLPRLHHLLQSIYRAEGARVGGGYGAFLNEMAHQVRSPGRELAAGAK